MGSSVQFSEIFAAEIPAAGAGVSFARFMELALYHPRVGYYAAPRARVGRDPESDFYTATTLGPVLGELVVAAAVGRLGPEEAARCTLVEIGAEPGTGVLAGVSHPFAGSRVLRLGDPLSLPEKSVVFSNELFDAQPCHRLVRRAGAWRELGVTLCADRLTTVELPTVSPTVAAMAKRLPAAAPEGYHLDLPLAAVALLERLVAPPWSGLFLACDYGRSWAELTSVLPAGTARAFTRHRQSHDLLAQPGAQDLTCDVCWDWLADGLREHGFTSVAVDSQEAFWVRHAGSALAAILAGEAGRFSARKQAVQHLLHPAHMGQKFQILHGLRAPAAGAGED